MNYEELTNNSTFNDWKNYEPFDTQYIRYAKTNPSIIAAGHKIYDVYLAFANARHSFRSAGYKNYGDLSGTDELSMLYTKTHFLLHAVSEYSLCLDLSWQVIWAYIQPSSFEYLMLQKYKKMEKECNRDTLLAQLECAISQKSTEAMKLKELLGSFDNDPDVMKLRSLNNSIKHQGTIHFKGLGANFANMSANVNGNAITILSRKSYSVEYIENLLFIYHDKFQKYFNKLITNIMPDDYLTNKVSLVDYIETVLAMNEIQNNS